VAPRRLPLLFLVLATVLALLAAGAVLAVFGNGGSTEPADSAGGVDASTYELIPAGDLPTSVADVRLVALDGGDDGRLGDLLGDQPVVVNFFASWCQPCIDEMPDFEAVHQAVGDQVTIIGMANRDPEDAALSIVERTGVTYPTYGDPESSAITYFGGIQMPTTVFIDAGGEVLDVHPGALTESQLRDRIGDLFGVPA
jgi:cytochrome c biogenesis protein CcmG, thiol:disulfide interchange protein DsbE